MIRFVKLHPTLATLAIASACLLVSFEFIFNDTTELFQGGAALAAILVNLSLSFLSGLLFYILTVYLPAHEKRRRNAQSCIKTTRNISFKIRYFFLRLNGQVTICDETVIPPISLVSRQLKVTGILSDSSVSTATPGVMMTNLQALESFLVDGIIKEILLVEVLAINFEPEYLEALYALKRCSLIEDVSNYPPAMWHWDKKDTLQKYESNFIDLLNKAQDLVDVTEKYYGTVKV
ncbi:hypothetical protein AB4167_20420 [Vibrio sp. 10N.286.49.E11]|jgi:hypothetical protein|nr:hypothetical protein [Vibrio sp. F13]TKF91462.1 hypothetical protein FCV73_10615 [Vibrio sp. F13]